MGPHLPISLAHACHGRWLRTSPTDHGPITDQLKASLAAPIETKSAQFILEGASATFEGEGTLQNHGYIGHIANNCTYFKMTLLRLPEFELPLMNAAFAASLSMKTKTLLCNTVFDHVCKDVLIIKTNAGSSCFGKIKDECFM